MNTTSRSAAATTRPHKPGPRFWRRLLRIALIALPPGLLVLSSCKSTRVPHAGRFPFSVMDSVPRSDNPDAAPMAALLSYNKADAETFDSTLARLQAGDVIGLVMTHRDAWQHLCRWQIQKIPYELFSYGHVAIVVPNPVGPADNSDLRLLSIAIRQPVHTEHKLETLRDQSWFAFRPPAGSIDIERLHEFARVASERAADPRKAYDYTGAFGLWNVNCHPTTAGEIADEYTCATLIVAALNYSGYRLDAIHRRGLLDMVAPGQVITSCGAAIVK